jgi:hypothetical protein
LPITIILASSPANTSTNTSANHVHRLASSR